MHPKIVVFILTILLIGTAHSEITRAGLEDKKGDIQSIAITEFSPHGRTVTFSKSEDISAFRRHFGNWYLNDSQTYPGRDFCNIFPIRYCVAIARKDSTDTLYLAVSTFSQSWVEGKSMGGGFQFFFCQLEKDGSYSVYLEGERRTYRAEDTPIEQYLAQLFPKV